jgi:predicted RNase H-like HicB family nuclease
VVELPGVLVYGATREDAIRRAWELAAEVLAEHSEGTERRD